MPFALRWTTEAAEVYRGLRERALQVSENRGKHGIDKSSREEGLFKQVYKCVSLLGENPRHPGLHTHEYDSLENPFERGGKVFEAYAQNRTPGAYRVFWCYGPGRQEITIIDITAHP